MRKLYNKISLVIIACIAMMQLEAQTNIVIPAANNAGTGSTTSPHRKPLGSNRAYERSAMKYTQQEIGMLGNITAIGFYCDTVINPGVTAVKVYIKEVVDSSFALSTVAAEEAGATLVFDDTLQPSAFVRDSFATIILSTAFLHATNSNIEVIVETNSGGTAGTDLTSLSKGFRYFAVGTSRFQYWQSATGSGTVPTGNGTLNNNRPNIRLTIAPAALCVAPPVAGFASASPALVCSGANSLLSLTGNATGIGMTYQWLSSPDSIIWTPIAGATSTSLTQIVAGEGYYACVLTCSGLSDTSSAAHITLNSFYECYCSQGIGGGCGTSAIDSVAITATTLSNGHTGCAVNNHATYPAAGNTTASLTQGQTYSLNTKFTGNVRAIVWIDYNQNGVFDPSEWKQVCLTSTANTNVVVPITIPFSATPGLTGMRIRSRSSVGGGANIDSTSSCLALTSGETEDYIINIVAAVPCTAPPTAGTTVSSAATACPNTLVNLSLNGSGTGIGLTYQWMSSTDGGTTWNPITGATTAVLSDTIHTAISYECVLTCSGLSATSTPVSIGLNSFYECYCSQGIGGGCGTSAIDSVAITATTLSNGHTGCAVSNHATYPAAGNTTASLTQGQTYSLNTKFTGNVRAIVWIDYDQNGVFDPSEWKQVCLTSTANTNVVVPITIPFSATPGLTGMRIRSRNAAGGGANIDSTSSCLALTSGETEDYIINIVAAVPCTAPPTAGTTVSSAATVCPNTLVNLSLNGSGTGIGLTYQWMSSTDGGATWNPITGATSAVLSDTVHAAISYECILTCSSLSATSSPVSIGLSSFYDCYCSQNIGGGCGTSAIDSVAISGTTLMNGLTGCSANNHIVYPASGNTTATLNQGSTYTVTNRYTGAVRAGVWIDYDQNGVFDTYEYLSICTTSVAGTDVSVPLTIPMTAMTGLTGMRIRSRSTAGALDSTTACTTFGSGETEDYVINIDIPLSIKQQTQAGEVGIYPNPSTGLLNISVNHTASTWLGIEVMNAEGEKLLGQVYTVNNGTLTKTIDLSAYARGIYFVRVTTDKETKITKVSLQ